MSFYLLYVPELKRNINQILFFNEVIYIANKCNSPTIINIEKEIEFNRLWVLLGILIWNKDVY